MVIYEDVQIHNNTKQVPIALFQIHYTVPIIWQTYGTFHCISICAFRLDINDFFSFNDDAILFFFQAFKSFCTKMQ